MAKRVQVVLTETISSLGKDGDVVDVAPGYARNFLFPTGKAVNVTPSVLKQIERKREKEKRNPSGGCPPAHCRSSPPCRHRCHAG